MNIYVILTHFFFPNEESKLEANCELTLNYVTCRREKTDSAERCLAVNRCVQHIAMAGVRAHTVWGTQRGWQGDLCQHLQHMGSKTLQLAHRESCSNSLHHQTVLCNADQSPFNTLEVQCGGQNISKPSWHTHNRTIEAAFFIKAVKVNHVHGISMLAQWKCWRGAHCDDDNSFIFPLSNS